MPDIHADRVLILDFGAQYTQLIARRVRELGVYSEIYACDAPSGRIEAISHPRRSFCPAVLSPFTTPRARRRRAQVFALGVPVLGICYGMQTMAAQLGGQVEGVHRTASSAPRRSGPRRFAAARRTGGQSRCAGPARAGCVDEPWRSRGRGAAGIQGHRGQRQCAARRHGG